jgi:hypothetical protein
VFPPRSQGRWARAWTLLPRRRSSQLSKVGQGSPHLHAAVPPPPQHPQAEHPSPCSHDMAATKNSGALVLRRREAVLSRVLPAGAEATSGECPLEVTPSGLGFCDRVVGTDAAGPAHHGQCVYIYICFNPVSRRPGSFLIPMGECRRTTPGGWRTARCSTAATSAGSRSPSASASARYIHRHRMIRVHRKFSLRSARPACIPVLI